MYFKIFLSVLLSVIIISCESTDDGSLDLEGTWVSNCYMDDIDEYTVDAFVFSGNAFVTSYQTWDNSSCIGTPIYSDSGSGTFSIGSTIVTSSGLEAIEVDFNLNYHGLTFTVLDIIRRNGNEFNYGVFIGLNTRPTEIDFNIILTKQ